MDQPSESALKIARSLTDTLFIIKGVRGVTVTLDWDDPKNPVLGSCQTRDGTAEDALSLIRRGAQMQVHMLNTFAKRVAAPTKEEPDGNAKPDPTAGTQIAIPGGPPVGGNPTPSGS